MAIRIVPHSADRSEAVHAFNLRMRAGGSPWGFFVNPEPEWLAKRRPDQSVWREYHLAVEDDGTVRGGFALKPQQWLVRGQLHTVTDWQGPFSEGAISASYGALGLRLVREMLKKQPLLYSWGHGGNEQPVVQMIGKMGWLMHESPFCLLVVKPRRFLRLNALLRGTFERRLLLDAAALSGAGSIGFRALHLGQRLLHPRWLKAKATEVPEFGAWADTLWERCKDRYLALAVRDAASMNALLPSSGWPQGIRLRVERNGAIIGWAVVMDTQMTDDARFGALRVGSIIDCFADPADAGEVVHAATRFLTARGVDIVVSNQTHPGWVTGFEQNGYAIARNRRLFAASPKLGEVLKPFEDTARGLHMTNLDGHGPAAL